jgi:hypothetical protein
VAKTKHHHHAESDKESVGFHRPSRNLHKDWRLWVAVGLMLVAMFAYVMTADLAWIPGNHPQTRSNASTR